MKTELQPGTVVRTSGGDIRVIDKHKPESYSSAYGRAYRFTSGTWDHESRFTVVSAAPQPAPKKVVIPSAIADLIETIRERDSREADRILLDLVGGKVPDDRRLRSKSFALSRYTTQSLENRKKFTEAIINGYERAQTPKDKIIAGIRDGVISQEAAMFVLEAFEHLAPIVEAIQEEFGSCAVR